MAKKTSHVRRETQAAAAFVDALRGETMRGGVFDSAAAKDFVNTATSQATAAPVPASLQAVFDEADEKEIGKVTRAILDGTAAYERMHGTQAPGDLIEQALPKGVSFEVFYDQADLVDKAVTTVRDALLMAFVCP